MKTKGIVLFVCMLAVLGVEAKGLKETSKEFVKVLSDVEVSRDEFMTRLAPFIEPHANVDSLCYDYYMHWKSCMDNNYQATETKIEKISKSSEDQAIVLISNVWICPDGEEYFCLTQTQWVKKDNEWYRSTEESELLVDQQINTDTYYAAREK